MDFFNSVCVICRLPVSVLKDGEGRLHSVSEASVQWGDKLDNYFIHGVSFDKELWQKITKRTLNPKEIFKLQNTAQKSITLQLYGYDKVLEDMKPKIIHEQELTIKGTKQKYQVLETDLGDDSLPARFVKVVCHSTLKQTVLRVPNIRQTETCHGAIAWTFGFEGENEKSYKPVIET